jgi:2-polyprenyl-3-methyl-5-hydroxy-6-metoxy-1,4-benzoquinol methylase
MDPTQGKDKSKEYYDQVAQTYKQMYEEGYDKYPANLIRLKMLIKKLKETNAKTVLDVGCGTCAPMIRLLKEGFSVRGCDFSPEMIKIGKDQLRNERFDPDLISKADVEDDSSLPSGKFDSILALGVFPHLVDEGKALQNLKKRLSQDGRVFIEFRNELFALFSSNRYTVDLILNKMLDLSSYTQEIKSELVEYYSKMYNVEKPTPKKDGKISYDDILARFRNPLTIEQDLFSKNGLAVKNIHFYHYHALPPVFSEKHPKFFREKSMDLEKPGDWRGNFMASAFVVEASLTR